MTLLSAPERVKSALELPELNQYICIVGDVIKNGHQGFPLIECLAFNVQFPPDYTPTFNQ